MELNAHVLRQVELVKTGKPYIMFGDGNLASCKPISERDLACFMADCVQQEDKVNQVLPIGGEGSFPSQTIPTLIHLARALTGPHSP